MSSHGLFYKGSALIIRLGSLTGQSTLVIIKLLLLASPISCEICHFYTALHLIYAHVMPQVRLANLGPIKWTATMALNVNNLSFIGTKWFFQVFQLNINIFYGLFISSSSRVLTATDLGCSWTWFLALHGKKGSQISWQPSCALDKICRRKNAEMCATPLRFCCHKLQNSLDSTQLRVKSENSSEGMRHLPFLCLSFSINKTWVITAQPHLTEMQQD